ncbi:flagellar hook-basal body complex protein FliE [Stratiformator vulcanicus]|uniref:Flagellar hook-basal body protein FliE n=1 Tax=Stratiformator vulcanicus TaxID=2527980 RepID=A0A517R5B9_9PLAN|nr:flagellar hook-basal body complex protein FliE [Stratiformator vulcanicus]QDT39062.1 flagellar hook-basal body protein FliE [Stratiformator vulcanicus]
MNPISALSGTISGGNVPSIGLPMTPADGPAGLTPAIGRPADSPGFDKMLYEAVQQIDGMHHTADQAMKVHLAGGDVTQVEALTAFRKADLATRMMLQVRNKLVDAFNEVKQLRM